jgi:hypothetical protein
MSDLAQPWGSDLAWSPTGDLATVRGTTWGQQRVIRRLLTAPGSYIWHPDYGAGLPEKIGSLATNVAIEAVVRSQMLMEAAVSQNPPPTVAVTRPALGVVQIDIGYTDAATGEPTLLPSLTFSARG